MDVHTPKGPVHGWRAFLGEVGVIVLGVLIALAAEQAVQNLEWRGKVAAAQDAMRLELLEDDGPQAFVRAAIAPCLKTRIDAVVAALETGVVDRPQLHALVEAYSPPRRTWDSEAWKAALASDVGTHMGAQTLVAWSKPYGLMPLMEDTEREARRTLDGLRGFRRTPGPLSEVEADRLLPLAQTLARLDTQLDRTSRNVLSNMRKLGLALPPTEKAALLAKARAARGACVTVPVLELDPNAQTISG